MTRRRSFDSMSEEESARYVARQRALFEAQDSASAARRLTDPKTDHSVVELEEAIKLFDHAKKLYEMLGNRAYEAKCMQHAIDAARVTIAARRVADTIKTGTDE
jgi:hypothetical protein